MVRVAFLCHEPASNGVLELSIYDILHSFVSDMCKKHVLCFKKDLESMLFLTRYVCNDLVWQVARTGRVALVREGGVDTKYLRQYQLVDSTAY